MSTIPNANTPATEAEAEAETGASPAVAEPQPAPARATRKSKRKKAPTSKDLTTPPRKYRKETATKQPAGEEMKLNVWVSDQATTPKTKGTKRKAPPDPNAKYECPTCHKEFRDNSGLKKHIRIHGPKRFVCQVPDCGKAFVESSKLKRHMLVHTKERPFACNFPDCGKKFSLEYNLRSHMRVHTGEKPFKCDHPTCGKSFSQLSNLKTHKRLHDPNAPSRSRKRAKKDPMQGGASVAPGIIIMQDGMPYPGGPPPASGAIPARVVVQATPPVGPVYQHDAIQSLVTKHPRIPGITYHYGTAGFRGPAATLESVVVRMGMLTALRARTVGVDASGRPGTKAVGVVITASHNPIEDNGLKLVDPSGGMLDAKWEQHAIALANTDEAHVAEFLERLHNEERANILSPVIFLGQDTRPSSERLAQLFQLGAERVGSRVVLRGQVTTPQVHYMVREYNLGRQGLTSEYNTTMSGAFARLLEGKTPASPLVVDCADGVGAIALSQIRHTLVGLSLGLRNTGEGKLNDHVGAEHVQKTRTLPRNVDPVADQGRRFASLDGDGDRVVYFYLTGDSGAPLRLLDGDKITSLISGFLLECLKDAGISLRLGVVQTAYANGASTDYLTKVLGVPVSCVKTGVKHLHHQAANYDIGVYFEANGHGTVVFNKHAADTIRHACSDMAAASVGARRLGCIYELVNQAIGDAISDILLVEAILTLRGWSLQDWDALYRDYPSRQDKVVVRDRNVVQTTDAERRCTQPLGLQDMINSFVTNAGLNARAFVRPSGTEDVVRIYAEASSQDAADSLCKNVAEAVKTYAGGV